MPKNKGNNAKTKQKIQPKKQKVEEVNQSKKSATLEPEMKEPEEEEIEVEETEDETLESWINEMSESATLTRERKCFLREVWDILQDINNSNTVREASRLNEELYDLLTSKYGQRMLRLLPKFSSKMEKEICNQYCYEKITIDSFVDWEYDWVDIFGKPCQYECD